MRILPVLLAAVTAFAADDAWSKVRALKSGAEIRVFKKGSVQPLLGKIDELTDDNLVVVLKTEQVAIPKDQIDRVDARPAQSGSRVVTESKTAVSGPDAKSAEPRPQRGADLPASSTSSSVSLRSRPDFETVYRRAVGAPKK